jgi:hypothetical protein
MIHRWAFFVGALCALSACTKPPLIPSGTTLRVAVRELRADTPRYLPHEQAEWVRAAVASCRWSRYWVTTPAWQATLSLEAFGWRTVRLEFSDGGLIGTNADGHLVSCSLDPAIGREFSDIIAG